MKELIELSNKNIYTEIINVYMRTKHLLRDTRNSTSDIFLQMRNLNMIDVDLYIKIIGKYI